MLIRIVRMTFEEENINEFLSVFEESKDLIRNFEGCEHLELLEDYQQKNIFITYSYWRDDKALDSYRNSALFNKVWSKTKPLFKEKPIAFSSKLRTIIE